MAKKETQEEVKPEEVKLEDDMANIYDEKTKEMSLDSTDFIKMNNSHKALSSDNDTDKKIDTQIADQYKKKNKILIAIICILVLTIMALLYGGYTLYSKNEKLTNNIDKLEKEIKALNEEIGKKVEPVIEYKHVFVGDSLIKNYNLSKYYSKYPVVNSNSSDLTTKDLLNKLNSMVYTYNPDMVFINAGVNDLNNKEDKDTIVNNIKDVISKIKEKDPNIDIYILSLIPLGTDNVEDVKYINEALSKLSNCTYVDIYELLKDRTDDKISNLYTDNKEDLNDKGYEIITEKLTKYMEK